MNGTGDILRTGTVTPEPIDRRGTPIPPTGDGGDEVTLQVITDFTSGELSSAEWNSLVSASDAPIYLTHEWQSTWWKYFGGGRKLRILLVRVRGQVAGIAPLFSEKGHLPGTTLLGLIGSGEAFSRSGGAFLDDGPSDYLDVLIDPSCGPAVGEAMADYFLRNRGTIERLDLVNLRPESAAMKYLLPPIQAREFRVSRLPGDICPFVPVNGGVADFIARLSPGVRRRLNQAFRLLDDTSLVLKENDDGALNHSLDDLIALHQQRWNAMGFPGLFFEPRNIGFQKAVAGLFLSRGWIWQASLYDGDHCVAARLGFSFQGRTYEYLSGFDNASRVSRKRPGLALWLAMYRTAHATGVRTVDLLRGDEAYKFELTSETARLTNLSIGIADAGRPDRRILTALRSSARFFLFLAGRERQLFRVQAGQHGFPKSVIEYVRFRGARFTRKFLGGPTAAGTDTN